MHIGMSLTQAAPVPERIPDPTFRRLLGEIAWHRLPAAVRERFAATPAPGHEIRYVGTMRVVRSSAAGTAIARLCRIIGTPLAPYRGEDVPVSVSLRADTTGGVVWERFYRFPGRATVRCASVKRLDPAEGLLECVGGGVGMWLRLSEEGGALHFRSTGYFWRRGRLCLRLPRWLTPGDLHVIHADLGQGRFRFTIAVHHPLLGETFFQEGVFAAG